MNSKAMAIVGILAGLAAGCGSSTGTETARDSAIYVATGSGGASGMGGATGTGGTTGRGDGGTTVAGTDGKGVGGSPGTGGASVATGGSPGTGGASVATGGSPGTGGASVATGGSPGTGGRDSGGNPLDGGQDTGGPVIDGANHDHADTPSASPIDGASDAPACIDQLISAAQAAPVGNPPVSFSQCTYRGQTVYYTPAQCCDQWSNLYAADCTVICAPDGGFTGGGDGRCPDFDSTTCTLVWRDNRTR